MKPKASYLKKVISYLSASKGNRKKLRDLSRNLLLEQLRMQACYFVLLCHNMKISCMKTHLLMNWLQERTTFNCLK